MILLKPHHFSPLIFTPSSSSQDYESVTEEPRGRRPVKLVLKLTPASFRPNSFICTTTCPSSCTSTKRSWRRATCTTTGWCGSRWYLRASKWTVGPRPPAVRVPLPSTSHLSLILWISVLRPQGCGEREDVHAARRQRLRPPGSGPGQGERGSLHLLGPLEGQCGVG